MNKQKPKTTILILFFAVLFPLTISGQATEHTDEHPKNEIGLANAPVYFLKEKVFSYGIHLHYIRTLSDSKFGIGIGYEQVFNAHKHRTFGLIGVYRPFERLSFTVSPGLAFESESSDIHLAIHLETLYEFEINNLHIGPVLQYAYDTEDIHVSLGVHVGYGF